MASENCITAISLWDKQSILPLFKEFQLSQHWLSYTGNDSSLMIGTDKDDDKILQSLTDLTIASKMACSVCKTTFQSRQQQVIHFKLDWHCENLKRREQGLQPITEEEFNPSLQSSDSISLSSSTSSSDTDEESIARTVCGSPRYAEIFFETQSEEIFSIHKCLILNRKEILPSEGGVIDRMKQLPCHTSWAVFLLGGGHFAAGIFKENEVIAHKTFHRYVIRSKQGTSQSIHDQHSKQAKSAGANLRRHNEMALVEEINTLLQSWSEHLSTCSHIFYRAIGHNIHTLCGKRKPLFRKDDVRLRNIPFPTKRASFQEVVRVHTKLSTVLCYGKVPEWKNQILFLPLVRPDPKKLSSNEVHVEITHDLQDAKELKNTADKLQTKKKCFKNFPLSETMPTACQKCDAKDRTNQQRISKREHSSSELRKKSHQGTPLHSRSSSCNSNDSNLIFEIRDESIDTSSLKLFEVTQLKKHERSSKNSTMHGKRNDVSLNLDKEQRLQNSLYTACKLNDIINVGRLLSQPMKNEDTCIEQYSSEATENKANAPCPANILKALNSSFGSTRTTLLHIASQCGFNELLWLLLESGADPSATDIQGRPPYVLAVNKDTRNSFRRFMSEFPEKYNYIKAQIPSPLSEETEQARMIKRQQKQQRMKARRAHEQEKSVFLKLCDSEKKEYVNNAPAKLRCFLCGKALQDKVPFEYNEFKFCTVKCLQQHRKTNNK